MARVHLAEGAELEPLPPAAWRTRVTGSVDAGARPIALLGRPAPDGVCLTAVLEHAAGHLGVWRTVVDPAVGVHALTDHLAAFHPFERELHERLGVAFPGHPWLKPVRFEGRPGADMDAYPFHAVSGRDVHEVQVGPVHAGVIEPGAFRFQCHGEQVLHLEIHLGYQHRGVRELLLARDPRSVGPLVESVAGDTAVAHAWAWASALEALAGLDPDPATELGRAVLLELERVAMHLASLSGLATDLAFLQGATGWGRLRTVAINSTQRLCGSRFGRSGVRPGAARFGLDAAAEVGRSALATLVPDLALLERRWSTDASVRHRLDGIGVVTPERARAIGLVGVAARASGQPIDGRVAGPYAARPIPPAIEPGGDCRARAEVRLRELGTSTAWLAAALADRAPPPRPPVAVGPLAPSRLVVAVVEGWRGEVVHALETDAAGRLSSFDVQDPSLRNWLGLAMALRGNVISDFPICNKSFDLSYCGNDL